MSEIYKPTFEYFSLHESLSHVRKGYGIKTKTLKKDIERGVKHLSEWSYSKGYGSTRSSLRFMNELMKHIDMNTVYKAELKFSKRRHYSLILTTTDGYTILFKGVSGGYFGEGTRGCYDILKACGFNEKQRQKVWHNENFKVFKRISTQN